MSLPWSYGVAASLVAVLACQRPPTSATPPAPPVSAPRADAAPTPADAAPRSSPAAPIDRSCESDADCVMTYDELTDTADGVSACCGGCVARAVNRAWHGRFTAACAAAPPEMCPPLGCADLPRVATCIAGGCVAASTPSP